MGTALLALCFCALLLVLDLFVGISPICDKAKIRFMYVGAALSLMAVPMMSHNIAGLNDIVDELRYQSCACGHRRCVLLLLRHGEITFDIDRRSFFTVAFDITIFSPKSSVNPYSQCP